MARAVCEAGVSISADEQAFLNDLRNKLALDPTAILNLVRGKAAV